MIYAGILAGGAGSRMQCAEVPKQFLMLGDRPVLLHTLAPFVNNLQIDEIIVAVPHHWLNYADELVRKYYPKVEKIRLIVGGETRNETIMFILDDIEQRHQIGEQDAVITHDAVRPFVSQRIIDDHISALRECSAIDTVILSTDTIVESADGVTICNVPLRSRMYQGQTPQSFRIKAMRETYRLLTEQEIEGLTDIARIFVLGGQPVHMVMGEPSNLKITTLYDLKIANAWLQMNV